MHPCVFARALFLALVAFCFALPALAQDVIPFDDARWDITGNAAHIIEYDGQQALLLKGGTAILKDTEITNGVIEYDIAFAEKRTFTGVRWRIGPDGTFEEFYFRPHLSGMPDANQYNPVFHGVSGWQLYHGPQYSAPTRYRFNEWQHVKIVFNGDRGEVYLDSDAPVLTFDHKADPVAGAVSVYAGSLAPIYLANFTVREGAEALVGQPVAEPAAPDGALTRWTVSNPFAEAALDGHTTLPADLADSRTWQPLEAERTGIVNLARVATRTPQTNTVFARLTLTAEEAKTVPLRFGYSDRVRVYLNGRLLYAGNNSYANRDYRYLGTMGLFDTVYLPLQGGENELWLAVAESFGGWGLMATLPPELGLSLAE